MNSDFRINIYIQIRQYYSIVFSGEFDFKPVHTSLYMFLLNQNNRLNWIEWFKCPFDLGMMGAQIGSKTTYYKTLDDLVKFGLIEYKKGINNFKAPQIKILDLSTKGKDFSVPISEPLTEPLNIPLTEQVTVLLTGQVSGQLIGQVSVPLSGNIYRLITNNFKLITGNIEKVLKVLNKKPKQPEKTFNPYMSEIKISDVPEELKKYFEIAKKFWDLFIQQKNDVDIKPTTLMNAKFKTWVDPIRKMVEYKECSIDDLREIYRFLENSDFWNNNIASTVKLRSQRETLLSQARKPKNEKQSKRTNTPAKRDNLEE